MLKLNLSITKKCNFRCRHCNIWRLYAEKPELVKLELTEGEFVRVVEETPGVRWVSITGGEPFLRDVGSILNGLPERVKFVSVNTNGWFCDRIAETFRDVKRVPGRRYVVVISLDGPRRVHDEMRGVRGAFDRAVNTFLGLRDGVKGVDVVFEFTVTPWNIGVFDELLRELEEYSIGSESFTVGLFTPNVYYNKAGGGGGHVERVVREALRISKMIRVRGPLNLFVKSFLNLSTVYYTGEKRHPCFAGRKSAWVDPNGDVRACIYLPVVFGNVRNDGYNVERILRGSDYERFVRACNGCWTPCESYTTMMLRPYLFVGGLVRGV